MAESKSECYVCGGAFGRHEDWCKSGELKRRKLTAAQARNAARCEALEEAAGHLELEWTDDAVERAAGLELAAVLRGYVAMPHRIARLFRKGEN